MTNPPPPMSTLDKLLRRDYLNLDDELLRAEMAKWFRSMRGIKG